MITAYKNARLIDAKGDRYGCLTVEDSRIRSLSADVPEACDQVFDIEGRVLMPAFIDLHCHLRDPGYPQKETNHPECVRCGK